MSQNLKHQILSKSLSGRLLFSILLCSTVFTLIATAIQLYIEYEEDVSSVKKNMLFIESSYAPAISRSLYEMDGDHVALQLDGALQLSGIAYLEVVEIIAGVRYVVSTGVEEETGMFFSSIDLTNVDEMGNLHSVGTLKIGATRDDINSRLLTRALRIFLLNALKTFLASLLIYWIIQFLVTRHINTMADYARDFSLERLDESLVLRRKTKPNDEFDVVVDAINDMRLRISEEMVEREKIENEKVQLALDLHQAEKLTAIGELAGGIAHDFNNQLQGVLGNAEAIKLEENCDEDIETLATEIITISTRSASLISKMMAFSRKDTQLAVEIDINVVLEEVVSMMKLSLDSEIILDSKLLALSSRVMGDSAQIQSAFLNLGLNARDAIAAGGQISFSTKNVWLDEKMIAKMPIKMNQGNYILASVSDNGVGIPEEIKQRVFEPFYTTKPVGSGTGMGLAAVYGTVVSHKGSISIDSPSGGGSCFHIYLPCFDQPDDRLAVLEG